MIVNELELGPFAGISEKMKIKFDSGLNIILGPNEAGKSTLVEALLSALFLQTNPGKNTREYKEQLKPLFPHPDGDTINVRVCIDCNGEGYQLKKTWGENPSVELSLPNGNKLSNETKVREKLDEILAYGSGTYRNVLISRQADMARTIESLKSNSEATNTIGEALRRTMFEADGVSVDALGERIDEETKALLKNWDLSREGPEKDRGYDNQWQSKGEVLKAYYDLEGERRRLKEAQEAEENYSRISNTISEIQEGIQKLSAELNELKSVSGDIQRRKEFEPKQELLKIQEEMLKKANREWPVTEMEITALEGSIKQLTNQKVKLEAELDLANAAVKYQDVRDRYSKVEPVHMEVQKLELQISELPNVGKEDLKDLTKLENEIATCKAALFAGKLSGRFSSQKPMNLTIQQDLDDPKHVNVEAEGEVTINAGGQIIIASVLGWRMELRSGEQDIENIRKRHKEFEIKIEEKKSELNVRSIDEVEQAVKKKEEMERLLDLEKGKLKTLLEGKSFESLKDEFNNLGEQTQAREPEQIRKELRELDTKQIKLELELKTSREKLELWKQEYGEHDRVFERLGDLNSKRKRMEEELEKLAPLPEAYESAGSFQRDFEEKDQRLSRLKEESNRLKVDLASSEAKLPEESAEDIEKAAKLHERRFQDLKNRARAILRVQDSFNRALEDMDKNPYAPLLSSFANYLTPLTANRYKPSSMSGPLPSGIIKEDGTEIPIDLLSTGTGDGTAIALRLAMAEHLLQDRKGFMIMDDPLVNLDPERRKAAAEVLRDFAGKFQLIVTTCDPNTAGLLGGNLIEI